VDPNEERLKRLEREVRDLEIALERHRVALEALGEERRAQFARLTMEITQLSAWLKATSRSTEDIAQSRIWRTLAWLGGLLTRTPPPAPPAPEPEREVAAEYRRWIEDYEWRDETLIRKRLAEFTNRPRITLIAPFGDVSQPLIERSVQSLAAQSYGEWELCLTGSGSAHAAPTDSRVRTRWQERDPWRAAFELASGDYIAVLDGGGVLAADALFHIVDLLNREPATDVVYCDEDCMDRRGRRDRPFFKPGWSPDLILSMNYAGRLTVLRRELILRAGGGSNDYDLLLRAIERTSRIRHIPRVLYHAAEAGPSRDLAEDRRAVDEHLRRAHPGAWTEADAESGRWRVRYPAPLDGRVSIIIPSGGKTDLLETNLRDLVEKTDYPRYEVVVIDNSRGEAVEKLVSGESAAGRTIRYIDWRHKPFNFAAICNAAASGCDSPFLLFLNDDMRVISPGWLRAMVELGARAEVGAVGAKLLFPDGTIQHAGIALGLYGRSGHLFKGLDGAVSHYFGLDRAIRNVSAVTGACLLVRADVFRAAGGFDQDRFPVDGNDLDLCLRIGAQGYRVLYTPYAQLLHYESLSKGPLDHNALPAEIQSFALRWAEGIRGDPFYNPNLTRAGVDCSPRRRDE